jgi:hypothetical protein
LEYNSLMNDLIINNAKICSIYGSVYKIKTGSILLKNKCFCNKKDVYGNVVNVCAKEFMKLKDKERKFIKIRKDEFDKELIEYYDIKKEVNRWR